MTASLLKSLKTGATAPRVVLLPDHRFFVRSVPVTDGATAAEAATQVELALETLSPFPTAQLYHGHFWSPGAKHALVFASYRKRFSSEQTAEWKNAELVVPAFAAMAAFEHQPSTTMIVPSADGLTAIHWDNGTIPSRVLAQPLALEADEVERTLVRDSLLKTAGQSRAVVDLSVAPEIAVSPDEKMLLFQAGEFTAEVPVEMAAALDVRDKDELAAMRRARSRDLILWRVFAGCALALGLLLLGEVLLLAAGRPWQKALATKVAGQQPVVDKIMTADNLATRIDELSTKRLLPLEMIILARITKEKRGMISFQRTVAPGVEKNIYSLRIDAQTPNSGDLDVYRSALEQLPAVENVVPQGVQSRGGLTSFTLIITFRPEALKAAAAPAPAPVPTPVAAPAVTPAP